MLELSIDRARAAGAVVKFKLNILIFSHCHLLGTRTASRPALKLMAWHA